MVKATRKPGGVRIDFTKRRKYRSLDKAQLADYVESWAGERLAVIFDVKRYGQRVPDGQLDSLARQMVESLSVMSVGHSPSAWMERDITVTSQLLDYRSRQLGRRLQSERQWALDCVDGNMWSATELSQPTGEFRALDHVEQKVAANSLVFAYEWQRYLNKLFICPPGDPPDLDIPFAIFESSPSDETSMKIAELAHCRPVGVFSTTSISEPWVKYGGRDECRQKLTCPHCHARNVSRLVQRVNAGPWNIARRSGKTLAMARFGIDSENLDLDPCVQARERQELAFHDWLRPSTPHYDSGPGDETMIRNISADQEISTSLTPHEVSKAVAVSKQLMKRCREAGMDGGIRFHSIGPKGRRFKHELAVVGEIADDNLERFSIQFGIGDEGFASPEIAGSPIESVVSDPGYKDAARLFIAGSSWKFDLDAVGASLNDIALRRTRWRRARGFQNGFDYAGLRGALAWQPMYLFSSVAFWSRFDVLKRQKFKSYHPFGHWRELLPTDSEYLTAVQQNRKLFKCDLAKKRGIVPSVSN